MKKVSLVLAFTVLVIFLSSCLHTLHPIFTVRDIIYEPRLVGNWITEKDGKQNGRVSIMNLAMATSVDLPGNLSSLKNKGYLIAYLDGDGKIKEQYIAFLASIGNHLYFDYFPAEPRNPQKKMDDFFLTHYVKVHTSYRVDILEDGSFELNQLDESYLSKLIDENKIRIKHEKNEEGDIMIITASTEELQQYLIKYGDEPDAYRNEKTKFTK